ncbi:hypothetical protein HK096_002312 [Nowakowskiella sp. JEL0078]|nr:hypothetical protein HK096_002312 [Nowakowskiella sp. JEL0078]
MDICCGLTDWCVPRRALRPVGSSSTRRSMIVLLSFANPFSAGDSRRKVHDGFLDDDFASDERSQRRSEPLMSYEKMELPLPAHVPDSIHSKASRNWTLRQSEIFDRVTLTSISPKLSVNSIDSSVNFRFPDSVASKNNFVDAIENKSQTSWAKNMNLDQFSTSHSKQGSTASAKLLSLEKDEALSLSMMMDLSTDRKKQNSRISIESYNSADSALRSSFHSNETDGTKLTLDEKRLSDKSFRRHKRSVSSDSALSFSSTHRSYPPKKISDDLRIDFNGNHITVHSNLSLYSVSASTDVNLSKSPKDSKLSTQIPNAVENTTSQSSVIISMLPNVTSESSKLMPPGTTLRRIRSISAPEVPESLCPISEEQETSIPISPPLRDINGKITGITGTLPGIVRTHAFGRNVPFGAYHKPESQKSLDYNPGIGKILHNLDVSRHKRGGSGNLMSPPVSTQIPSPSSEIPPNIRRKFHRRVASAAADYVASSDFQFGRKPVQINDYFELKDSFENEDNLHQTGHLLNTLATPVEPFKMHRRSESFDLTSLQLSPPSKLQSTNVDQLIIANLNPNTLKNNNSAPALPRNRGHVRAVSLAVESSVYSTRPEFSSQYGSQTPDLSTHTLRTGNFVKGHRRQLSLDVGAIRH